MIKPRSIFSASSEVTKKASESVYLELYKNLQKSLNHVKTIISTKQDIAMFAYQCNVFRTILQLYDLIPSDTTACSSKSNNLTSVADKNKARTSAIPLIENFSNEVSRFSKNDVVSSKAASSLKSFLWEEIGGGRIFCHALEVPSN